MQSGRRSSIIRSVRVDKNETASIISLQNAQPGAITFQVYKSFQPGNPEEA
jgi:hypothetical protein